MWHRFDPSTEPSGFASCPVVVCPDRSVVWWFAQIEGWWFAHLRAVPWWFALTGVLCGGLPRPECCVVVCPDQRWWFDRSVVCELSRGGLPSQSVVPGFAQSGGWWFAQTGVSCGGLPKQNVVGNLVLRKQYFLNRVRRSQRPCPSLYSRYLISRYLISRFLISRFLIS